MRKIKTHPVDTTTKPNLQDPKQALYQLGVK